MARILLLVVIALLVVASFRGFRSRARSNPPAKSEGGELMVTCARCGVHQPRSIALFEADKYYCKDNPRCRP